MNTKQTINKQTLNKPTEDRVQKVAIDEVQQVPVAHVANLYRMKWRI